MSNIGPTCSGLFCRGHQLLGLLARTTSKPRPVACRRFLNLHEYQSKGLLNECDVAVQRFFTVGSTDETKTALVEFARPEEYVVKAQILAGGRGKGILSSGLKGGVKLTRSPDEVMNLVKQMIGHTLVTKQTGTKGAVVHKVMVCEALDIARETYVAILMDRESQGPVVIGSPIGGVDIEEVAVKQPDQIFKVPVDITDGLSRRDAEELATSLKFHGDLHRQATEQLLNLYNLFLKVDATMVEINPFGETKCGKVVCFDAKINFDDSAEFRQRHIFEMRDPSDGDPRELAAEQAHLNYIGLDGNIACLVNGAGLAMATMDLIKLHGGEPANFLDVGGMVQEDQVAEAFKIITSDANVKAILVNIFGGIVNCATIANGLTNAFKKMNLSVPLVVRLEGTNVEAARAILQNSSLPIIAADDLDDAAQKAVASIS